MLLPAAETLFEVFGYTRDKIQAQVLQGEIGKYRQHWRQFRNRNSNNPFDGKF